MDAEIRWRLFLRFIRIKTSLQQGVSLFKDPTSSLTCPLRALAVALAMQAAPASRLFPQFAGKRHSAAVPETIQQLTFVELLEADGDASAERAPAPPRKLPAPGAHAYVNRLLARVQQNANAQNVKLTKALTSHSFRRGGAMHANDGTLAENWIIQRGGWQLDRVNKAFGYMLGTAQADQRVSRVLSGWCPKDGARKTAPVYRHCALLMNHSLATHESSMC